MFSARIIMLPGSTQCSVGKTEILAIMNEAGYTQGYFPLTDGTTLNLSKVPRVDPVTIKEGWKSPKELAKAVYDTITLSRKIGLVLTMEDNTYFKVETPEYCGTSLIGCFHDLNSANEPPGGEAPAKAAG